ncbi:MAG: AraC family transcriptional regulator ligand-binding domain-containing protein [Myxococcota bacterium]|nr:AraC family transcriptional regulator ligand-binding domain-containing protein [Myxococcota bacterium]
MGELVPIQVLRSYLQALGLTLDEVQAAVGLPLEGMAAFRYEDSLRLWQAVEALTGDPSAGHHAGAQVRVTELGALGGVLAHARDVREALENLGHVVPLVLPGRFEIDLGGGGATITYERPAWARQSRHGIESLFAALLSTLRHSSRRPFAARAVALACPVPAEPGGYDHFYGVPVGWSAPRSHLELDREALDLPMAAADPQLSGLLMTHAEQLLSATRAASAAEQRITRAFLAALHLRDPTLEGTARQLGVGARTLQRQLDELGVSFRDLRARQLRERAELLLSDPSSSVEEIAELLGYDSRGGFDRAFRAWTGTTPAAYRRALRR